MSNTNYISSIVKILEIPNQTFFNDSIPVTKFRVQFPQMRSTRIINLIFWGNLAKDIGNYYKVNDYIMIEGYLSLNHKNLLSSTKKNSKKVEITVLKVYPFLMSSNRKIGNN